jgi:hypothetical protein
MLKTASGVNPAGDEAGNDGKTRARRAKQNSDPAGSLFFYS